TAEFTAVGNDLPKLQVLVQRLICDDVRTAASDRIAFMIGQREEAARREEAMRREAEERQRQARCRNEQATAEALGNDLGKLQDFVKGVVCEDVRALAQERIAAITAQREADERRRQEAERICSVERPNYTAVMNDLAKLREFAQAAACEQVRLLAADRIKIL